MKLLKLFIILLIALTLCHAQATPMTFYLSPLPISEYRTTHMLAALAYNSSAISDIRANANGSFISSVLYNPQISKNIITGELRIVDVATRHNIATNATVDQMPDTPWFLNVTAYAWDATNPLQVMIAYSNSMLAKFQIPKNNYIQKYGTVNDPLQIIQKNNASVVFSDIVTMNQSMYLGISHYNASIYTIDEKLSVQYLRAAPANYSKMQYLSKIPALVFATNNSLIYYSGKNFSTITQLCFNATILDFTANQNGEIVIQFPDTLVKVNRDMQTYHILNFQNAYFPRFSLDGKYITIIANNTNIVLLNSSTYTSTKIYEINITTVVSFPNKIYYAFMDGHQLIHYGVAYFFQLNTTANIILPYLSVDYNLYYPTSSNIHATPLYLFPILLIWLAKRKKY